MPVVKATTKSGQDFSAYPTVLAYLRDINNEALPEFYKAVLQMDAELNKNSRIPKSLQNARPVRGLVVQGDLSSDKVRALHPFSSFNCSMCFQPDLSFSIPVAHQHGRLVRYRLWP